MQENKLCILRVKQILSLLGCKVSHILYLNRSLENAQLLAMS